MLSSHDPNDQDDQQSLADTDPDTTSLLHGAVDDV